MCGQGWGRDLHPHWHWGGGTLGSVLVLFHSDQVASERAECAGWPSRGQRSLSTPHLGAAPCERPTTSLVPGARWEELAVGRGCCPELKSPRPGAREGPRGPGAGLGGPWLPAQSLTTEGREQLPGERAAGGRRGHSSPVCPWRPEGVPKPWAQNLHLPSFGTVPEDVIQTAISR